MLEPRDVDANRVLVVDDNEVFLSTLERSLRRRGLAVATAASAEEAMRRVRETCPARVVLDMNLGRESGLQLIPRLLDFAPSMRIVVLTGYASIATAIEAIRLGAANYLPKPADVDEILVAFDPAPRTQANDLCAPPPAPMTVRQMEWEHLQRILLEHDGNISATARALGLHRRSLQRKLRKHAPA